MCGVMLGPNESQLYTSNMLDMYVSEDELHLTHCHFFIPQSSILKTLKKNRQYIVTTIGQVGILCVCVCVLAI